MKTVKEISALTGISVRTLHYYDEINLLKPSKISDAGYRLYDDTALERLHRILLLRELQFPLKEIRILLDSPDFDTKNALKQQIKLLEMQKKRLEKIILSARELLLKGDENMNLSAFDKTEVESYIKEAKQKWGLTEEYKEFEKKQSDFCKNTDEFMHIFAEIGAAKHLAPESDEVQKLIEKLQNFITENYYTCTKDTLLWLGRMYTCDERFKNNIDKAGGSGTADFCEKAIKAFCRKK